MREKESILRPVPDWGNDITLVPFSGVQMLDFGFDLDSVPFRSRRFIERITQEEGSDATCDLIPLFDEEDRNDEIRAAGNIDDVEYGFRAVQGLEPFLEKWVPVPVLRVRPGLASDRSERYDDGPFGWARLRVVELARSDPDTGHTHRIQIAFDTTLVTGEPGGRYLQPVFKDSEDEREFRLVSSPDHVAPFLTFEQDDETLSAKVDTQAWVADWIEEIFIEFKKARVGKRALREEDFPYRFEHLARFLTLLAFIERAVRVPRIKLVDVVSDEARHAPLDVDLVLDIGNSRTCGILIESTAGQTSVDLSNSYGLEIRDLSRPELHSAGLIDSRVEFAAAEFGREHIARRSGRRDAFQWPSIVRTGPEANRMVRQEEGTETASGLSSPKRYLWDLEPSVNEWRFQNHMDAQNMPRIARSACRYLNDNGDVIEQVRRDVADRLRDRRDAKIDMAVRPRFSRSALYGFLVGELISHALVQINDPASRARRARSAVPRRLRTVILTPPSATPMQEQAIIRSRAEGAIRLIWSILGLGEDAAATRSRPKLVVDWDEASCTQLVWLYTEIARKFEGRIDEYMALKGRPRVQEEGGAPENSIRIACIDIGGGTTDLMVTSYFGEGDRLITPRQVFREGFRIAGDDVTREVVASIVLDRIADSIEAAGGVYVRERLRELFGGDVGGMDQRMRQMRRQFSLRILGPLAVATLNACEGIAENATFEVRVADVIGYHEDENGAAHLDVPSGLAAYLEDPVRDAGARDWRLADTTMRIRRFEVDTSVRGVLQKALQDMGRVIDHLGVDVILLTGRPSRLPAVRALIRDMMIVPPDRLVSMHRYRVEEWYPFRDPVTNEVGDPKSTVAVGGMLCALSSSRIANFRLRSERLQMRSTARFVGVMHTAGQIFDKDVLFAEDDSKAPGDAASEEAVLPVYNPVHVGFRQIADERWTTTPLYLLDFANESVLKRPLPVRVTLRRRDSFADPENPDHVLRLEAAREAFVVEYVEDGEGDVCYRDDVRLRLQTLGPEDHYWLDTGIVRLA